MNLLKRCHWIRLLLCIAAAFLTLSPATVTGLEELSDSTEDRLVRRMCSHGLEEAAIRYVRARRVLERDADAVAWWFMREMECYAHLAMRQSSQAEQSWAACRRLPHDYQQAMAATGDLQANARWPWLQWQLGRCHLLEAQSRLAITLANPANLTERDRALELVRWILQSMDDLQLDIQRRQPLAARQSPSESSQAPPEQLRNLSADAQLLKCEALLVRSQLYPQGSADRTAALAEMQVSLKDVLDRTGEDWPMRPAMLLAQAIAQLDTGDEAAFSALSQLATSLNVNANTRIQAGIALARAYADRGRESLARSMLNALMPLASSSSELSPVLRFARIELEFIGLNAVSENEKQERVRELAEETRQLGELYGDYWRTRAEALMVSKLSSDQVQDAQLATKILLAEVRQLTAAGQMEQACSKLLLARDTQDRANNGQAAIELASLAAALLRQENLWLEAAEAVQGVAVRFHFTQAASEAHLWAIRARAEAVRSHLNNTAIAEAYQLSLADHLKLWPRSESSSEALQWLRDWFLTRGMRLPLINILIDILSEIDDVVAADKVLVLLLEQAILLNESERTNFVHSNLSTDKAFSNKGLHESCEAIFSAAIALVDGGAIANWSSKEIIDKRMQLFQNWLQQPYTRQLSTSSTVATALVLDEFRIGHSLAGAEPADFNQLSLAIRPVIASALLGVLDAAGSTRRSEIWNAMGLNAQWVSDVFENASPEVQTFLDSVPVARVALARIAILLGDAKQAEILHQQAERHSRNATIQIVLAYHLLQQQSADKALQIATRIAALTPPGTPLNWSARWCMLRCQMHAGQSKQSMAAAQLLLATQPGMDMLWSNRFEAIARESSPN